MLYKEITPHIRTLTTDAFPTYVIQKLLAHGPRVYFGILIANLMGHVLDLSLHLYGCRVIQKAFEISGIDQQIEMAKELESNLFKCIFDQHANHAIQKCIECVQPQYIQFIYRRLCGRAKMLSTHPYGCHVVQKMLEFCKVYHGDSRLCKGAVGRPIWKLHCAVHCGAWRTSSSTNYYVEIC
uniref:PUM-HD domain-containing protein n=1 Tax=Triticum urartu TaxID=4572 RepID=A0A8R7K0Q7_TRIUA